MKVFFDSIYFVAKEVLWGEGFCFYSYILILRGRDEVIELQLLSLCLFR